MTGTIGKVALLWRGDRAARNGPHARNARLEPVFEALRAHGLDAEAAVYTEEWIEEIRSQLMAMDAVLVWVDPISDSKNRIQLDALLRDIASQGVWVSTHPDVILKMGVKEVLHRTRHLGWGTDTALYRSDESLRIEFPSRLNLNEPRVLKRNRGNGGQGIWKVERTAIADATDTIRVVEACRGSVPLTVSLDDFLLACGDYIRQDGCVIDQPFQARLHDGMIRCYVSCDRVVGFGHQLITALLAPLEGDPDAAAAQPGPRIMHSKTASQYQSLRTAMESEWIPQMIETLQLRPADLPVIWDADFLYGPRSQDGADTYVLCEINVSSVLPIPEQAPEEIAGSVAARLVLENKHRS
jgi:uncharacterized protein DUF6815